MTDRLAELRRIVTENYEDMRAMVEGLRDEDLDRRTENGWTVRQAAGHIAAAPAADSSIAARLSRGANAGLPRFLGWLADVRNWWTVRRYAKASKTDIFVLLENEYATVIEFINGLEEEDLDRGGTVPARGRMTAYEYLARSPEHARAHAATIKAALA
jgi:hypothetical protein